MLIDWFTVGAQALNFLVLVWLLKHFLYKPILNAIDVREKGIAAKLASANAKEAAAKTEHDDLAGKNKAFDDQRGALLTKATDDAKAEHDRLVGEAHKEADQLRAAQATALKNDQAKLGKEITRTATQEVFSIARKALADLATVGLEERLGAVFTKRLREMDGKARETLAAALKSSKEPAVVTSAFDMPAAQIATIQNAVNETFSAAVPLRFESGPDAICGIQLMAGGQKVGWSISDYLASLDRAVGALLEAKPAAPAPQSKAATHEVGLMSESGTLQAAIDHAFGSVHQGLESFKPQLTPREVGIVTSVAIGIATISGLPGVGYEELVRFPGGILGIAFNVDAEEIGVVLLGDFKDIHTGDEVERTGRVMDVAVGEGLLGRVLDPMGNALDGKGPVASDKRLPIERPAPPIMDRAPVDVPLQTGLKAVDALVPVARGQRELILGDRQTGKTAIAIDTILNQRGQNVICVYCAIGQRASAVAKVVANLQDKGAMEYTVVMVAEGNVAPGLVYITPYAATSIAEYFMEKGRDVLIVYDDLTHHARAYRELSLLLRRPPGREAFPGDIFYIHSRMLERATHLSKERGSGSLTALPVIETTAQDISAYIPTNLISITDGQIYLSPTLFELGVLPAIEVGKSVSRVGGQAQRPSYRAVAGDLKLAYAQFEELESFTKFGTHLDDATRKTIDHGERIRVCLKQAESNPWSIQEQICVLLALASGLFDPVPLGKVTEAEAALQKAASQIPAEVTGRFESADKLSDADRKVVLDIAKSTLAPFQPKPEAKK